MMKNHSYDNYLGMLRGRGEGFRSRLDQVRRGLLDWTSPENVAASIASSASGAARRAPNSSWPTELANTSARPRRRHARNRSAAPGSGRNRVRYVPYRAL